MIFSENRFPLFGIMRYSAASLCAACAVRSIASARYSGDCAPDTANLPPKMKQGTPSMPASLAESDAGSRLHQRVAVGKVGTLREIKIHQLLLHLAGFAFHLRPADQPVTVERIGLPLHLVGGVGQAFRGGRRGDALGDALVALGRAELLGQVFLARYALARNPVIEEIRAPMHLDRDSGPRASAFSRRGLPIKHHGQTTSETTSIRTGWVSGMAGSCRS